MGKDEENTDNSDDSDTPQPEVKPETVEKDEEEDKEVKAPEPKQEKNEEEKDTKKVDNLRKVIKVEQKEGGEQAKDSEPGTRENLEQKRAILQSIKDFDFQIKKNQEEITSVNKKLDSVSKDLDDLVSLYEIVSEQMNPFVGLSKVTKKRIDALENFTKEIEDLKNRMGDIESFAVKAGTDLKSMSLEKSEVGKETKSIEEKIEDETNKTEAEPEIKQTETENEKKDSEIEEKPNQEPIEEENIKNNPSEITPEKQEIPIQQTPTNQPIKENTEKVIDSNFTTFDSQTVSYNENTYDYLDTIIEQTIKSMSLESRMDHVIDEFIESLKT